MPKPLPKWEIWKHVPTLTAEQAVALTLGVDPHKVGQWGGGEDIWVYNNPGSGTCSTVKGFVDRLFLFKKCFGVYGEISPSQLTVWAKSVDWDMPNELEELATGAPAAIVATLPDTSPSGDDVADDDDGDWKIKCPAIAQKLGEIQLKTTGAQQVTARNICEAVQAELAEDSTTHGRQGPRSVHSVRTVGLKGWKFCPPKRVKKVD